jgi:hypothetical protein
MLLIFVLLTMTILAYSLKPTPLSGNDGAKLLMSLMNNSENITSNNTTLNLSRNATLVALSGDNGTEVLENLSKSPANLSFGPKPRSPPPPPIYDYQAAQLYTILRQNHLGY